MYETDRDKLLVILGYAYETGRIDGYPGDPDAKAIEVQRSLNELCEFLDIEFDEEGDITHVFGVPV